MTNPQKKKKKQEVMEAWTMLKEKFVKTITELKEMKEQGFREVYKGNSTLITIPQDQETDASKVNRLEKQVWVDRTRYEEQLRVQLEKYTRLETKLEVVRSLIADNQLAKLKKLCQQGKI